MLLLPPSELRLLFDIVELDVLVLCLGYSTRLSSLIKVVVMIVMIDDLRTRSA